MLIEPVVVNYVDRLPKLEEFDGSTLTLYLGSSIGNFMPQESRTILRNIGSQLRSEDTLVLGTDLVKDESTLIAAYDDNEGVTALHFRNGETIHTENSYKFTNDTLGALLSDSGFDIDSIWKDGRDWYALTPSRRHEQDE